VRSKSIDDPSIFKFTPNDVVLTRMFPTLDLSCEKVYDELVYLKPNKKGRDPREGHTKSPNPV
jgi:hypothetical protein